MTATDTDRKDDKNAPDPEHPDKPDTPREIEKRSWKYVLTKTIREFGADECTDIAAALTYYAVLALFPALLAVFSILGVMGQSDQAVNAIMGIVEQVAPDAAETVRAPLEGFADSPAAGRRIAGPVRRAPEHQGSQRLQPRVPGADAVLVPDRRRPVGYKSLLCQSSR